MIRLKTQALMLQIAPSRLDKVDLASDDCCSSRLADRGHDHAHAGPNSQRRLILGGLYRMYTNREGLQVAHPLPAY